MFKFPKNLYTDVRIEDVYETNILVTLGKIEDSKVRRYKAAFIRVFDGERWYYTSTSKLNNIQDEINTLASYAKHNKEIYENPIVKNFQVNTGNYIKFDNQSICNIDKNKKFSLIESYFPLLEARPFVKMWNARYADKQVIKEFYSSKGANLKYDMQKVGFRIGFDLVDGSKKFNETFQKTSNYFEDLLSKEDSFIEHIVKCEDFLQNSVAVESGKYTVILAPTVAGTFAHESFGHKSEADNMLGSEAMKKEWSIGKRVGSHILSIVDDGNEYGGGYTPFDDEGSKATKTFLVENGILNGRLHNGTSAAYLEEELTGNARAVNFEYEPIVRMTTTYIMPGNKTKDELFSEVKEGIYIENDHHGSGMSTFTIAPSLAYYIRDGKIAEPVRISVVSGNVMETLLNVDGVSNNLEISSSVGGGCGKMEQFPLSVGLGGPYVRVNNIDVQ